MLNLTVENSRTFGVLNEGNPLYIDNYTSINNPTGVRNAGSLTLINANFTGGTSTKYAIDNVGMLFARDIRAQGYQKALNTTGRTGPTGLAFTEYSSGQVSQFPSPTHSMNLPNKPIPDVPWEQDTTKWGNVWVNTGGLGGSRKTDSASFQTLIDNPNLTTICVPYGKGYTINGDILVRGNIQRIIGTGATIGGTGRLVITSDVNAPAIRLERLAGLQIVNRSNKTVIIESYNGNITSTGTGDMFICDWVGDFVANNASQRIWAWQFNAEGSCGPTGELCLNGAVNVNVHVNNVLAFRIFGWKDEGNAASIDVIRGAVEILGFMNYPSLPTTGQTEFLVENEGQLSIACASQISFNNSYYANLVRETRNGVTKTLTSSNSGSGGNLPLYTGYDSLKVAPAVRVLPVALSSGPAGVRINSCGSGVLRISWADAINPSRIEAVNVAGRVIVCSAIARTQTHIAGLPAGMYAIRLSGPGFQKVLAATVAR